MKCIYQKGKLFLIIISALILVFLTSAPFLYLCKGAFAALLKKDIIHVFPVNYDLLANSVLLNTGAALCAVILGFFAALFVWTYFHKYALKIAVFLVLLVLIPPYIHVQSWIFMIDAINAFILRVFGIGANFTGVPAYLLTVAFSYLPVTACLTLLGLLSVPGEIADLCLLEKQDKKVFFYLYFPLIAPYLLIGGLLVFLFNINDFGIPSVFGVKVFALEIYSRFSAGGDIFSVFISSFPLLAISIAFMFLFGCYLTKSSFSLPLLVGRNPFSKDRFIRFLGIPGFVVLAFFMLVPLFNLTYEAVAAKDALLILRDTLGEFSYSLLSSFLGSFLSLIPAIVFAYLFYRSKRRLWLISLTALPFVIPAPICGLALIEMYNTPLLSFIYGSPWMLTVGLIARFTFIEAIVLAAALKRLDTVYIDNLRVHYAGLFQSFRCLGALLYKECLASALIVFALSVGEFGVSLLVTPAGYQTVTIKIYNYLHYGASDTVAVLCLAMLVFTLAISMAVYFIFAGRNKTYE